MNFGQLAKWQFFQLRGLPEQHAYMEKWIWRKIQPKFYDSRLAKGRVNCRIVEPKDLSGIEVYYDAYQPVEGCRENNDPQSDR